MSHIKLDGEDGSAIMLDADRIVSVTISSRKTWLFFGSTKHFVKVGFRDRPDEQAVFRLGSLAAARGLRDRLERAMLS